jgi:aspartate carbamoyltransferase regulatory subunit
MKKQELQVAALENGTVIDHIPSEKLFTVVSLLGLETGNHDLSAARRTGELRKHPGRI